MFNEEKVKKDLERMRMAYEKAIQKIADLQEKQDKISNEITEIISNQQK